MKQYKVTYICIKEHIDYLGKLVPVGEIVHGTFPLSKVQIDMFKTSNWDINTFEEIVDKSPPVAEPSVVPVKNIRWLNRV